VLKPKELIQFVIPVFNEIDCIHSLLERLLDVRATVTEFDVDFIFVDDGSLDGSLDALMEYADRHEFIKLIGLSKNFGHQAAVTAGLAYSIGDYVCIIDADLQDPPELVGDMYAVAKSQNADVVYGQRKIRKGETKFKRMTAYLFYRLLGSLCEVDIPLNTGDFRLISRRIYERLNAMPEKHRFIRGMVPWLGFKSVPLLYERDERVAGETKYPFKAMVRFACDAIFSFSIKPLRVATYCGAGICLVSVLGLMCIVWLKLFTESAVPGVTIILSAVIFIGGMQLIFFGILGEYIGRIFEQSKSRPLYVVRSTHNIKSDDNIDTRLNN